MGNLIQLQEMIAISNNGEILKSAAAEQRGKAIYVREASSGTDDRVERMAVHIANLATAANTAHMNLKGSTENVLVTRLTTNEFSLYTKDSPLSLAEYKLLIKRINEITSTLPPNIHLLLATIPVHWPDNSVHNCALYAQSPRSAGEKPIIHHFAKEQLSATDFNYIDKTGNPLPLKGDVYGTNYSPTIVLSDTEVVTVDAHQFGSALKIVTAEGESFITLIDICLDHESRVAEKNLAGLLAQLKACGLKIPLYMSQVITSHTIAPIRKNVFTSLTQADKDFMGVNGLSSIQTSTLSSSFGDFVDITLFPPTYLEIPYRKRVLRNLSTVVPGKTILEEAITNPGLARFLGKRVRSLAGIGVNMNQKTQQQYQTLVDNFLFSVTELSDVAGIQDDATPGTTDDSTSEPIDPELTNWVELLLADVDAALPQEQEGEEPIAGASAQLSPIPKTSSNPTTASTAWPDAISNQDRHTSPWASTSTAQESFVNPCNDNPYSLFFEAAPKQVARLSRPFKDYSTLGTYPRFFADTRTARSEEVGNRRHCNI